MARVTISNGEVTKHLADKGFILEVKYRTRDGEDKSEKWTVWGKQPALGTVLEVEGDLSVKLEEFTGDAGPVRYARGHINNPVYRTLPMPGSTDPYKDAVPNTPLIDTQVPF